MGDPPQVFDPLNAEFGFTLDPCATAANAKCAKYFTEADDGLTQSWAGERVLEIDGPEGGTDLHQTAAAFGRALRREVKPVQLPEAAWQNVLEAMGMPADRTGLYIEMVKSFNSGWIHFGNPGTEKFHGPTTIEAFAQEMVK